MNILKNFLRPATSLKTDSDRAPRVAASLSLQNQRSTHISVMITLRLSEMRLFSAKVPK